MTQDLLTGGRTGRFWRGNIHCHSDQSDGHASPDAVVRAYREAGYDFLCLSDHFEADYGWRVVDTRPFRDEAFTTILGAELSSAAWDDRLCYWVVAAGLSPDFAAPPATNHAEAIRRAREAGAFLVMLHPGINNLPLAAALAGLPGHDAIHAVEVYNHNAAMGAIPDRDNGAYMLDGLLEAGRKLLITAADDAHWGHPRDRFGGWLQVHADRLDADALVASLKAGHYYATQGPEVRELKLEGDRLTVRTSEAYAISLTTSGDRWHSGVECHGEIGAPITEATFDLAPFRGTWCRAIVVDEAGRRAWANPVWP